VANNPVIPTLIKDVALEYTSNAQVDTVNDYIGIGSAANSGKTAKASIDVLIQAINNSTTQRAYLTDATLVADDLIPVLTNYQAPGSVTLTLPQATVGAFFDGARLTDNVFRFEPYGAESFLGGDPGGYLEILDFGDVAGYCYVAGQWTIYAESHANMWRLENGFQGIARSTGVHSVRNFGVVPDTGLDVSANLQIAIDSGFNLSFSGGEYLANNLTQSTNHQKFYGFGDVRIIKNANGVLFASSGTGVEAHGIKFYGDVNATPTYTGNNVTFSGANCSMINSGSRWAAGRALKATGQHFQLRGTNDIYQTADATGTGYDVEIGVTGTATLYHQIEGVYSSQFTGGILLIDTGSADIIGGQFGKLKLQSNTSIGTAPGQNGGNIVGARIGGAVVIEQSSALFAANLFGSGATIDLQVGAGGNGVSGVSIDASNVHSGATITSAANAACHIVREQGTNGTYDLVNRLFGPDAGAAATGLRTVVGSGVNPEGNVTAGPGSTYTCSAGGNAPALWVKETGTGNTGWRSYRGLYGTAVYNPANLVDGAGVTTTVTVTGAALGDYASASFGLDLQGITFTSWVSAANTVSVRFQNETGGAIDLGNSDIRCRVFPA
jgi:hypothetical protein